MKNKGLISLLVAGFIYGTFGVLVRFSGEMFTDLGQVWIRGLIAFLVIGTILFLQRQRLSIPRDKRSILVLFALSSPVMAFCFTASITLTKASNTVFMVYVGSILISFAIGSIWLQERVTRQKLFALSAVLVGLVLFIYPFQLDLTNLGLALGLIAGLLDGLGNVLRKSLSGLSRQVVLFYQFAISSVAVLLIARSAGDNMVMEFELLGMVAVVIFGILIALLGNLLLYGFQHFDANVGTIVLASELFFSLIINRIVLGEIPSVAELCGGILIFLSVLVLNIKQKSEI